MKTLTVGSFASGLTSPSQVFTICLGVLADVAPIAASRQQAKGITKIVESGAELSLIDRYQLTRAISSIFSDLNHHVPPLTYFGYHPADKTQLGVWIDLDALHLAEKNGMVTQVSSDDWRGIHSTYVLDMSKSSLILYRRRNKEIVWTIA